MNAPSETLTAAVGSVLGAVFIILNAYGVTVSQEVAAAIITLVGWTAAAVTWYVRKREGGARVPPGGD